MILTNLAPLLNGFDHYIKVVSDMLVQDLSSSKATTQTN